MGQSLAETFPVCRAAFDAADHALREPLSRVIFDGPAEALTLTENTQPAILTMSVAAARLLDQRGIQPDFVAGHSLGEYSAHVAAGTLAYEDAVRLVRNRGRYMQEAVPAGTGAMAAILGLDEAAVVEACARAAQGEVVSPANLNGAGQIVIAGTAAAVRRAGEQARALGAKRVIPLNVSAPFHCALMNPAGERLAPELRAAPSRDPRVPVVANVDALPRTTAAGAIEALIAQVSSPVRWADSVTRLVAEGTTTFIEVGPGTVLSGLVRKIARGAAVFNLQAPADLAAIEAALVRV
ncbi:MAG: ACP S-malonyltransferase [Acidobacteria bacterium]|nr:ACP S-malonyltransferase [Acidobacteriota bacterium]